jgi:hypothetical protein
MYPLNMQRPEPLGGFALANDEAEHAALTAQGYEPPLSAAPRSAGEQVVSPEVAPEPSVGAAPSIDDLRAQLDAKGIAYSKHAGAKALQKLLDA